MQENVLNFKLKSGIMNRCVVAGASASVSAGWLLVLVERRICVPIMYWYCLCIVLRMYMYERK